MRIILADDHQLFRDGLCAMLKLQPRYDVIDAVGSANELLQVLTHTQVDLVLLDYRMPGGGALSALSHIKSHYPGTKVAMLTGVSVSSLFQQFLTLKADGILIKDISSREMLSSINMIETGVCVLSPTVEEQLSGTNPQLTKREFEVLELIVEGLNNSKIAKQMNLSIKTVGNHRFNLMQKLELKNSVELMHYALDNGLIGNG